MQDVLSEPKRLLSAKVPCEYRKQQEITSLNLLQRVLFLFPSPLGIDKASLYQVRCLPSSYNPNPPFQTSLKVRADVTSIISLISLNDNNWFLFQSLKIKAMLLESTEKMLFHVPLLYQPWEQGLYVFTLLFQEPVEYTEKNKHLKMIAEQMSKSIKEGRGSALLHRSGMQGTQHSQTPLLPVSHLINHQQLSEGVLVKLYKSPWV